MNKNLKDFFERFYPNKDPLVENLYVERERSHDLKRLISEICATRINPEVKIEYNKLIEGEK